MSRRNEQTFDERTDEMYDRVKDGENPHDYYDDDTDCDNCHHDYHAGACACGCPEYIYWKERDAA